jgi:hypothetical protein
MAEIISGKLSIPFFHCLNVYLNEEVSSNDLLSGNSECGMCETVFKVEGLDAVKISATLD